MDEIKDVEIVGTTPETEVADQTPVVEAEPVVTDAEVVEPVAETVETSEASVEEVA